MTESSRWLRAKEIFSEAVEAPAEDRAAIVRGMAGDDSGLRRDVEELLALHGEPALAIDSLASRDSVAWPDSWRAGELLAGRYRVEERLGGGGMGEVWRAMDTKTAGAVAIKSILPFASGAARAEERFLREVRMASRVEHRNVCRMIALDAHAGRRFCVMELLSGDTLSERLRSGPMSAAQALPIVRDLCAGLEAAHAAGVVHRDLKPSNVILEADRAVIIDFGLAAAMQPDVSLTATGEVIGTLAYMAPEQFTEGESGPASDLYALGVVMYEMLTGRKPHQTRSPFRLAAQKAREAYEAPSVAGAEIPRVWQETIGRCLRANPKERFGSAAEVRRMLERGRASARFLLARRRVWVPSAAAVALASVLEGWRWMRADYAGAPEARIHYEQAQAALAEASPLRATKLLEQAIGRDPDFVEARALLAASYAGLDQPERAREAVIEADRAAEHRIRLGAGERASLRAARSAVVRDHKQTASHYLELASSSTGSRRTFALVAAARAREQAGERDESLRLLESAVSGDPANAAARVRLGVLLSRVRQQDRARSEFRAAEEMLERSGNVEGLCDLLLARSMARLGGPDADRSDLERVMSLSQKTGNRYHHLTAKFRMAVVAEQVRDYDGAVRIAREASEEARREGMLVVAAQALGELGYAFLYKKIPAQAEPFLHEAVELAEKAKATGTVATNRMRLGEVLGGLGRQQEAVPIMEPAVEWLRKSGSRDSLALSLIKWGTVLSATDRFREAEKVFEEALALAETNGNELYQAMAIDRLGSYYEQRNLPKALRYRERALAMGKQTSLTRVFFLGAQTASAFGRFDQADRWIRQGEAEIARYPLGNDRSDFKRLALRSRGFLAQHRTGCAASLPIEALDFSVYFESSYHVLRGCSPDKAAARASLAWLENRHASLAATAQFAAAAGAIAFRLGEFDRAQRNATRGLEAGEKLDLRDRMIESLLVLRAVALAKGNRAEAGRLGARLLEVSKQLGFDPPERFNGRRDLLWLWNGGR